MFYIQLLSKTTPLIFFQYQGGTADDEEAESELSLTQLKQMGKMREEQLRNKIAEEEERERRAKEREAKGGCRGFRAYYAGRIPEIRGICPMRHRYVMRL